MLEYDRQKLGKHLKTIREQSNFTQAEVSKRLGYLTPQFISNIERGIAVAPIPLLAKMSRLYKTNPEILANIILESQKQLLMAKLKASCR